MLYLLACGRLHVADCQDLNALTPVRLRDAMSGGIRCLALVDIHGSLQERLCALAAK